MDHENTPHVNAIKLDTINERDYKKIPKNLISTSTKIKDETIVQKLTYLNCKNDIGNVNYNAYGCKGYQIEPIGRMFVDNIVLAVEVDPSDMEKGKNKKIGVYNTLIRTHFEGCKVKALNLKDNLQTYKVDTASMEIEDVYKILETEKIKKDKIIFMDIDITRDYTGCFNKNEIIEVIEQNQTDGEKIIENTHTVGNNCLTVYNNDKDIRTKIYNKFVQELESYSVRGNHGDHLYDWCNAKTEYRKQTQEASLETGLLRIETTFYKNLPSIEDINNCFEYWTDILSFDNVYKTPIREQWRIFSEHLKHNMVFIVPGCIYVVRWFNSLTGKIGGLKKTTDKKEYLDWILSELTLDMDIDLVHLKNTDMDTVEIGANSYIKTTDNENRKTQLTSRNYIFQKSTADIEKYGINTHFYGSERDHNVKTKKRFTLVEKEDKELLKYIDPKISTKIEIKRITEKQNDIIKNQKTRETRQKIEQEENAKKLKILITRL